MSSLRTNRSRGSPPSIESTGSSSIAALSRESTNASASSTTTPTSTSTASIPTSAALFLVRHRVMVPLVLRGRTYAATDLLVMAIINRTPDSFYDKGATYDDQAALAAVGRAVQDGADIVDVGGVKAGPGGDVSEAEEIERVAPFVRAVRERHPELVISVDTWRSGVADACLVAGADVVNDAWGGVDAELAVVA